MHRDVKPGNVLLGSDGRARLTDFGIARLLGDTVRHTKTGSAIGTASYLAPEQVRGDPVTLAVDIYALGLVLLEALTGRRVYEGHQPKRRWPGCTDRRTSRRACRRISGFCWQP